MSLRGAKQSESDAPSDTLVVVVSGSAAFLLCPLSACLCWLFCRKREDGLFSTEGSQREADMVSEPSDGGYMCPTRTAQPVLTRSVSGFLQHVKSGKRGEYVGDEVDTCTKVGDASLSLVMSDESSLVLDAASLSLAIEALVESPSSQARDAEVAVASKASDAEVSSAAEATVRLPQSQARGAEIALTAEAAEGGKELIVVPLRAERPVSFKDDDERVFLV